MQESVQVPQQQNAPVFTRAQSRPRIPSPYPQGGGAGRLCQRSGEIPQGNDPAHVEPTTTPRQFRSPHHG